MNAFENGWPAGSSPQIPRHCFLCYMGLIVARSRKTFEDLSSAPGTYLLNHVMANVDVGLRASFIVARIQALSEILVILNEFPDFAHLLEAHQREICTSLWSMDFRRTSVEDITHVWQIMREIALKCENRPRNCSAYRQTHWLDPMDLPVLEKVTETDIGVDAKRTLRLVEVERLANCSQHCSSTDVKIARTWMAYSWNTSNRYCVSWKRSLDISLSAVVRRRGWYGRSSCIKHPVGCQ